MDRKRLTIRGTRMSKGNAVECPKVRTDDGQVIPVSYLSPSIAIGERIEVTGYMANVTKCTGLVLHAEGVHRITD